MVVSRLSKDDEDTHLFKMCVEYKAKDTMFNSDFWPEYVGCRPFCRVRKQLNRVTNREQQHNGRLLTVIHM